MFGWLKSAFRRPVQYVIRHVRARYDAAQTNNDNARHWAAADSLSAAAANSELVRTTLRQRARYEVANNGIAAGIVSTLVNDVVGTGPRLQLPPELGAARELRRAFQRWSDEVSLADKLRTLRRAQCVDGECFAVLTTNARLLSPVQLDLRLVECDRVADTMFTSSIDPTWQSGIKYDEAWNPVQYRISKGHPGDMLAGLSPLEHDDVDAAYVIHVFRSERPGQLRGIPEITPTLGLFAELRRYTLAVLAAAETAADFAWFMTSTGPGSSASPATPFDTIDIERRMGQVLPEGWGVNQLKAEQPTTTYGDFRRNIINEAARPLNMPYNVAACDSSSYNYASGRMDHQTYYRSIEIDREAYSRRVLDRIFYAWLDEASRVPGMIPAGAPPFSQWDWTWHWDGFGHVDPNKEASAQSLRLATHTTTLRDEYARQGQDWSEALRQRALELDTMRQLGLPIPVAQTTETEAATDGQTQDN